MDFFQKFGKEKCGFKFLNKIKIFEKTDSVNLPSFRDQINSIYSEINSLLNELIKINLQKEADFLFINNTNNNSTFKEKNVITIQGLNNTNLSGKLNII